MAEQSITRADQFFEFTVQHVVQQLRAEEMLDENTLKLLIDSWADKLAAKGCTVDVTKILKGDVASTIHHSRKVNSKSSSNTLTKPKSSTLTKFTHIHSFKKRERNNTNRKDHTHISPEKLFKSFNNCARGRDVPLIKDVLTEKVEKTRSDVQIIIDVSDDSDEGEINVETEIGAKNNCQERDNFLNTTTKGTVLKAPKTAPIKSASSIITVDSSSDDRELIEEGKNIRGKIDINKPENENLYQHKQQPPKKIRKTKSTPNIAPDINHNDEYKIMKIQLPKLHCFDAQVRKCKIKVPIPLCTRMHLIEPTVRRIGDMSLGLATCILQKQIDKIYERFVLDQTDGLPHCCKFRAVMKPNGMPVIVNNKTKLELPKVNSDDDITDDEDYSQAFNCDNILICQQELIKRKSGRFKVHLKNGIMRLKGKDYVFKHAEAHFEF